MNPSSPKREASRLFVHFLPALLLASFATILFWWNPFGRPPEVAYFEALLRSNVAGEARLIHDVDGTGLKKGKAISAPVEGGGRVTHVRFTIPAGQLRGFIFTPLDREGEVDILRCWCLTQSGDLAAVIDPKGLHCWAEGDKTLRPDGVIHLRTRAQSDMLGLIFMATPPIDLALLPPPPAWKITAIFIGSLVLFCWLSLIANSRVMLWKRLQEAGAWATAHPVRSLLMAAVFSATLSCFPVVFGGKSFVSPENGMPLLYDRVPTVPGATSRVAENPTGSDMGATMYWHLPASMVEARAIFKDGEFPLWNRYNWSGVTLLGQNLSMIGDPLNWMTILADGQAWAWDVKFVLAKILFAFGVGLLVWRTSGNIPIAALLALSAPYIGFFCYRFCHAAFFSICYAPWILLPWIEAVHAKTVRRAAIWAGVLIFADWWELNSGTAKESSALLVFLNGAGVMTMLLARQPWRFRLGRLALFGWASVIFLLLSAPLWVVFLDALGKAYTLYDKPQIYQMQPAVAVGLFDDIFHRQLLDMEFLFNPSANFFVLLGTAWAMVRLRVLAQNGFFLAMLGAALPAAALAFGVFPSPAIAAVPMLRNIYHFDNTFSCVLFILLFVIAGFGLRECLARMRHAQWRGDWILAMSLVGMLLAAYFGYGQAAHRLGRGLLGVGEILPRSTFFFQYGTALILSLALLPWAWRFAVLQKPAGAVWAAVALAAFATMHFRHGMYFETKFDLYTMNPKNRLDLRAVPSPAIERIREVSKEPSRVLGLDWVMTSGYNAALGLETISGPDALENPAMLNLADILGITRVWDWRLVTWRPDFPKVHRALDMLNVRYFLDTPASPDDPSKRASGFSTPGFLDTPASLEGPLPGTKHLGTYDLDVLESETAWPRAFFTDAVGTYANGAELRALVEGGDGRPFAAMTPGQRARLPFAGKDLSARVVNRAQNYRLTNNTTSFEIDAPTPGLAVLMEANSRGDIEVYVDGQPAICVSVDHAFRGVLIEKPGRHVVKFGYWPKVLGPALWLSVFGLVCLLLSAWVLCWRRRPAAGTVPATAWVRECMPTNP